MTEQPPKYEIKPGQPPLGARDREKTAYLKFALLESQLNYLKERSQAEGVSMAEYLRRLIDADMAQESGD